MQLKAAGSAGALDLLSPVAVPGLILKTRGGAPFYNDFRGVLPKGKRENSGRTSGLETTRVNRIGGQLTLQRAWRQLALSDEMRRPVSERDAVYAPKLSTCWKHR
jgi:hypothetical protein